MSGIPDTTAARPLAPAIRTASNGAVSNEDLTIDDPTVDT
jgi:hypothetical protein